MELLASPDYWKSLCPKCTDDLCKTVSGLVEALVNERRRKQKLEDDTLQDVLTRSLTAFGALWRVGAFAEGVSCPSEGCKGLRKI